MTTTRYATPRPWVVTEGANLIVRNKTGEHIVDCDSLNERGKANAALIVAAVNAYDALRAENEAMRKALEHLDKRWGHKFNDEDADIIEAALARAGKGA